MNSERPPRRALVTGVSSGIGAAIAERLLQDGWLVEGMSRSAPSIDHPNLRFTPADLMAPESVAEALAALSPIDALVHAAGVMRVGKLGELAEDGARAMWRLHVEASTQLVEHVVPRMPDGDGRIVLIGSRTARGAAGRSQYAATKAAMVGLARSWALELAPRGITVNVVAPGATDTPMLKDPNRTGLPPKLPPLGRFIKPEEVAALTAFLLSDAAAAITGQQILVCGGASL
ncbi:NAD(P)-dependent dehydrogenase (short-subunit alcohol dehydrogenase family) [Azospirillum lipoferum]|uniref:SDR family oxidoreductase n=1 Tax=Azospirillum lipoferum TaxID=193 RepID=A0A5A9GPA4_AZOLI|nr:MULTISPECIES: SDR family oxidoreductase [Azospirillum]KAA0596247.1 SDR family oxidoreductase [Azospirillum lipoferum]MCP1611214.1 NAD(P)-dependent dehydrogenase (short-subunit alcohol dehydrogenase family) [Azospirillum lipoferum]MDW5533661.1 SDR family oxidoreductase [Azospirillum sp. NL1]